MDKIELAKEQQQRAIEDIREYFSRERNEELGNLGGMIILDFITDKLGKYFYNQAITDIQKYLNEKVDELYVLMK